MRHFNDGAEIYIEPWRASAFPVVKDLVVDRSAFDRIIQSGGYISNHSGPKPEPNSIPVEPQVAETALDAATCIGCGACVAACPNGSAMLFTAAKGFSFGNACRKDNLSDSIALRQWSARWNPKASDRVETMQNAKHNVQKESASRSLGV